MVEPLQPIGPLSPWRAGGAGAVAGVVVEARDYAAIVGLSVMPSRSTALRDAVRARWDVELPETPRRVAAGGTTFLWQGPLRWLMLSDEASDLAAFRAAGAVSCLLTDSRIILRLTGTRVRDALAKLLPIDLDPRAFRPDDTALTVGAHINLQIWQLGERDGPSVYEIAIYRSLADSFHQSLCAAAAEYGVKSAA